MLLERVAYVVHKLPDHMTLDIPRTAVVLVVWLVAGELAGWLGYVVVSLAAPFVVAVGEPLARLVVRLGRWLAIHKAPSCGWLGYWRLSRATWLACVVYFGLAVALTLVQ